MQSDQLYVQGVLTCNRDSFITSNATLMVFYFILSWAQRNFGKNASFLISRSARPISCCYQIFMVFRISFQAFRSFFVLSFYMFSALYLILRFSTPLIALLHRLVYLFVILLRYTSYSSYKVLKCLCNVSTRRFSETFLNLLESRALLRQSFLKHVKNYLARPNDIWNSRC